MECRYDVFISYSRYDNKEVLELLDQMQKAVPGLRYWFDIEGIKSGDEFDDEIIGAIESSNILLFAVSRDSLQSKWVKKEVQYAINVGKKVIPVLLGGSRLSGWALFNFGLTDCVDKTKPMEMKKLFSEISNGRAESVCLQQPKERSRNRWFITWITLIVALLSLCICWYYSKNGEAVPETGRGVDLGLSVLWAEENLCVSEGGTDNEYFAWGHVTSYDADDLNQSSMYGRAVSDISNNPSYDIASRNSSWRIPTLSEFQELSDMCRWTWKEVDGVPGYEVVGPNGNAIFLPAFGYLHSADTVNFRVSGNYWTATSDSLDQYNRKAYALGMSSGRFYLHSVLRGHGFCIRPVRDR